jgi:hypothetical protein
LRRRSRRRRLYAATLALVAVAAITIVAALHFAQPASGSGYGPQETTTQAPVSITGFVQAPTPPETLQFNSTTTGKEYSTPVTETACSSGAGGVCFIYYISLPPTGDYTVFAILQGEQGNVCDAGTVDVTTVGNYNIDVTC